uniref:WD repeat-containing protein 18 n=1 Tax=Aceria tosichella TaxID=561515 RepID=A0A6G1SBG1_9ACAR
MVNKGPIEVALSTDLRGAPYSFSLWDIYTGAQLVSFKGNKGSPISRCLHLINHNYFITAIDNVLQIWSIYNRKSQDQKLFLPGRPSALCASSCGNYLIVAIAEMIYIWQLGSGNLLAHTQRHYQTVTVLKLNQDDTFLFSGGEDGQVLVWPLADLLSNTHNTRSLGLSQTGMDMGINEPRFTWQHHSAPITDIHISNSGLCITASTDKTINIYSCFHGRRLHCVSNWPSPITCVAMNKNESRLFLGAQDGNIYELAISSLSLSLINSKDKDGTGERRPMLTGHKDRINHLLISLDGTMLISGANDSTCKIWDVPSGKMLRDIKHQAPIANLVTFLVPDAFSLTTMTQSQAKPPLLVKPLKRNLHKLPRNSYLSKKDLFEEASTVIVNIKNKTDLFSQFQLRKAEPRALLGHLETKDEPENNLHAEVKTSSQSNRELRSLKTRLRELYLLSAEKIFQDVANESLKPYQEIVQEVDKTIPRESKKERAKSRKLLKRVVQTNGVKDAKKAKIS